MKLITSGGARTQTLRMVPGSLRHQVMVGQSAICTSKRFLRGASAADPHAAQTHNKVRNQGLSGLARTLRFPPSFPTTVDTETRIIWLFQDKRLQTSKPGLENSRSKAPADGGEPEGHNFFSFCLFFSVLVYSTSLLRSVRRNRGRRR